MLEPHTIGLSDRAVIELAVVSEVFGLAAHDGASGIDLNGLCTHSSSSLALRLFSVQAPQ